MISISNEDEHDGVKNRIAVQMYRVSQKESHPESDRGKWSWLDIEDSIGLETLAIYHISGTHGNEVTVPTFITFFSPIILIRLILHVAVGHPDPTLTYALISLQDPS